MPSFLRHGFCFLTITAGNTFFLRSGFPLFDKISFINLKCVCTIYSSFLSFSFLSNNLKIILLSTPPIPSPIFTFRFFHYILISKSNLPVLGGSILLSISLAVTSLLDISCELVSKEQIIYLDYSTSREYKILVIENKIKLKYEPQKSPLHSI